VDFIAKPFDADAVLAALNRALGQTASPEGERAQIAAWRAEFASDIVGESEALYRVFSVIERIADTDCNVLITGASGTGKELVARTIHRASARSTQPFVPVNCAAIPKVLIESEIFGHAKGAFTGANEKRAGRFEVADGGTLFLDEVGEMDPSLQAKFLRVIQEKEFTPVGSSRTQKADVRIVAATNQDLEQRCKEGLFREDLYYRLNVVPIELPELGRRRDDIPLLVDRFVAMANARHGRNVTGVTEEAGAVLLRHHWPGNVRELANLIERVTIMKRDGVIGVDDLPASMNAQPTTAQSFEQVQLPEQGFDIKKAMEQLETRLTLDALERSGGNKARAAALLGLKRTTLIERLKKLNLNDASS